jgi:hypothetical protein
MRKPKSKVPPPEVKEAEPRKVLICDVDNGEWCVAMQRNGIDTTNPGERRRGIAPVNIMVLKSGEERTRIIYRTSATDRGVFLNFCPWCGSPLLNKADGPDALEAVKAASDLRDATKKRGSTIIEARL